MSQPVLFIADLHLDSSRPEITATFTRFLRQEAPQAAALYILGDLFEAWIGDDAVSAEEPILKELRQAAAATSLYVMHGNRDFLLGARFAELSGATLLPEPSCIDLHGERTLILHGDSLCTADHEHQTFRTMVHDPQWQQHFLSQPIAQRLEMAQQARNRSRSRNQELHEEIMDVTPEAVTALMAEHEARWLIHGHTHRPAVHRFTTAHGPGARFVVGDWFKQGSVLRCTPQRWELEEWAHHG
ncbi:UDP-2,3-diacylglucosamine diphosphatase [Halorhodospira abdelmalekii]|uniref:UDP-2,3-diacylglucosamine diphosphatase n=1 Tax=Halorhodospira abdelmalekii TaxID=421629 RepID=UPI00190850E6|nr:UDP-2,3-diacylglucosamine diphosphatase [Halorhodospira abdelmalekii]